ncbi:uncharacterized protein LOC128214595 [Mya arenaria]|nr:uncharacterized protein LOC128214595 [Mya arenaria]
MKHGTTAQKSTNNTVHIYYKTNSRHPNMTRLFIMHILIYTMVNQALGMQADVKTTLRHMARRNARFVDRIQNLHSDSGNRQRRAATQSCELTDIADRLATCVSATAAINNSTVDLLSSICGNVECNIQCFTDAVGDCYQTDQNFYFDPSVVKMEYRAMCANTELTTGMFTDCVSQLFLGQCFFDMSTTLASAVTTYYAQQNYASYKQLFCSAFSTYASCLNVQASGSCSSEEAKFAKDFMLASTQYAGCGDQTHVFYTTYAGDLKCRASQYFPNIFITHLVAIGVRLWG